MKKHITLFICVVSVFINAALITVLLTNSEKPSSENSTNQYPFLSKRIFSENQNDILINFIPLREAIRDYVGKQDVPIGIYFEYLPSGTTIGVNENLQIKLASLIKIPLAMATYKQIEVGKLHHDTSLTIKKEYLDDLFGDLYKKGAGTKITVHEAILLMLQDSDNTAAQTLLASLPKNAIDEVFDSLDLPKLRDDAFPLLSAKGYTSILKSLYLSSYLTKDDSNEILYLLSNTKFKDKLPAGIPQGITVSHKIGEFNVLETGETIYSDCGIVYYPKRPYSLCIMVSAEEDVATKHIVTLSKMVSGYIDAVNR